MAKVIKLSKEQLQQMIDTASVAKQHHIIGRALVILLERQTETEQANNTTNTNNDIGFTGADAKTGCMTAKTYLKSLKHKRATPLFDWQLEKWLKKNPKGYSRITKYWAQINDHMVGREDAVIARLRGEHVPKHYRSKPWEKDGITTSNVVAPVVESDDRGANKQAFAKQEQEQEHAAFMSKMRRETT